MCKSGELSAAIDKELIVRMHNYMEPWTRLHTTNLTIQFSIDGSNHVKKSCLLTVTFLVISN